MITPTTLTEENILIRTYDLETLQQKYPDWGDHSRLAKHHLAAQTPAESVSITRNTTVDGLHETIVDLLNPTSGVTVDATNLALGTGTATPSSANTSLNNEVGRVEVTEFSDQGTTLATSTFLDTGELNGFNIEELGLTTASTGGRLLNHSLVNTVQKDDTTAVTFDVSLSFQSN
jgi:hypothetical protein